jgi:uncharacterized protein (TIGR02284 family)
MKILLGIMFYKFFEILRHFFVACFFPDLLKIKHMDNREILIENLNELIMINNDRIAGYQKAADLTKTNDIDLYTIFHKMENDSRGYVNKLTSKIIDLGGEPAASTTISGKIYRAWMDLKNVFTDTDKESILESCEFGEDAAQKAYDQVLHSDAEMNPEIRNLILDQKEELKSAHDIIKKYRDLHHAFHK